MNRTSKKLTWFGHNCFLFEYGSTRFLTDPFFVKGLAPVAPEKVDADYLLVSHAHGDHCADATTVARKSNGTIVGVAEVADFYGRKSVNVEPINIGGAIYLPCDATGNSALAQVLATPAPHSSTFSDGTSGGNSLGFVLSFSQNGLGLGSQAPEIKPLQESLADADAFSIYFACDAGYFSEMEAIGRLKIDVAVLPIGDRYTMGPSLSLDAINAIKPRFVVPAHYDTWAPIAQDAWKWSEAVVKYTQATPLVLRVGGSVQEDSDGTWK